MSEQRLPPGGRVKGPYRNRDKWVLRFYDSTGAPARVDVGDGERKATRSGAKPAMEALRMELEHETKVAPARRAGVNTENVDLDTLEAAAKEYWAMAAECAKIGDKEGVKLARSMILATSDAIDAVQKVRGPVELIEENERLRAVLADVGRTAEGDSVASFASNRQSGQTVTGTDGSEPEIFGPSCAVPGS